ncbi:MAG: serine/threonine protein kinase [Burkholderiales bacterium]|nr:serine/threonine protein kinase [Burkholderiales bacterium]
MNTSPSRAILDASTWARVGDVVHDALAIADPAARLRFVDTRCSDDPRVRAEVLSLLAADQGDDGGAVALPATHWLADEVSRADASLVPVLPPLAAGTTMGTWTIDALLAEGGMGAVYRAHRSDGAFDKTVAIKVLRPGRHPGALAERLATERQLLARLDHPGIARLIDGGTRPDGAPYLVMELVDGVPIDRWCDQTRPPLDARLRVFLQVCDAVQFAHQQLVLHRDLKPGNILVTADRGVKLLDFGIAQIMGDEVADATTPRSTASAMTPMWASPEQLRGEAGSAACDVYTLGVLLFRLLTARLPYAGAHAVTDSSARVVAPDSATLVREILDGTPAVASATVGAHGMPPAISSRALRGDLDAVIARALAKPAADRYATVAALAADLRRFLAGEPISARPHSGRYVFGKFLRRHRWAVSAGTVGVIALATLALVALHQAREADAARRVADDERARAVRNMERVRGLANDTLFDVHDALRNVPGTAAVRAQVAARSATLLETLARESDLPGQPLATEAGRSWLRLAIIQGSTASASTAQVELAAGSYRRAIELLANDFVTRPGDTTLATGLVRALRLYGIYLATHARGDEAPRWLRRAVVVATAFVEAGSATRKLRMEHAAALTSLAFYARESQPTAIAERRAHAQRAFALLDTLAGESLTTAERSELDEYRVYLLGALSRIAHQTDDGRVALDGVLDWAQRSLDIAAARSAQAPDNAYFMDAVATAHLDVVAAAQELKRFPLAAEHGVAAVALRQRQFDADPGNAGRQMSLLYALSSLAEVQAELPAASAGAAARQSVSRGLRLLASLTPAQRETFDMVAADMGLHATLARVEGRAAAVARASALRAAACRAARDAYQVVIKHQPRWEGFHKTSLEPELEKVRADMTVCGRAR